MRSPYYHISKKMHNEDKFFNDMLSQAEKIESNSYTQFIKSIIPNGQQMTRDMHALQGGYVAPPHLSLIAEVCATRSPYIGCEKLANILKRLASHIEITIKQKMESKHLGTRVFIGHGRSHAWRDLKDFVQDRLNLPWDEFNRVPVAGFTNIARLSTMMNNAAVAFIIMTAEDEQLDGKMHARMNVIHEAGLFQGKLGFEKAILMLEESCEEFSNVQGLGQIRFPKGNISAAFESVRQVLEREELITEKQ